MFSKSQFSLVNILLLLIYSSSSFTPPPPHSLLLLLIPFFPLAKLSDNSINSIVSLNKVHLNKSSIETT